MAPISNSCQQFVQHQTFKIVNGSLSRLSVLLVLLLSLFLLLESLKHHPRIANGASSVILALKSDVKLYPSRNTSGLPRHPRKVPVQPSYKIKVGLHLLNATLAASCLVLLAGDVSSNPGPIAGGIPKLNLLLQTFHTLLLLCRLLHVYLKRGSPTVPL